MVLALHQVATYAMHVTPHAVTFKLLKAINEQEIGRPGQAVLDHDLGSSAFFVWHYGPRVGNICSIRYRAGGPGDGIELALHSMSDRYANRKVPDLPPLMLYPIYLCGLPWAEVDRGRVRCLVWWNTTTGMVSGANAEVDRVFAMEPGIGLTIVEGQNKRGKYFYRVKAWTGGRLVPPSAL